MEQEIALAFAENWYCAGAGLLLFLLGISLLVSWAFIPLQMEAQAGLFIFGMFAIAVGLILLGATGFQLTRLYVAPELAIRKQCR
jgi:hypothetical protein